MLDSCHVCGEELELTECPECEEFVCDMCWSDHAATHDIAEIEDDEE